MVNRDQLEILASLRESVNEDKVALERDMEKLQTQIKELSEKNKMQLEQINALLLEKVSLQSESIGQRERMLEREKNFRHVQFNRPPSGMSAHDKISDLKASINGKDIPEEVKGRLLSLHEENIQVKEQLKTTQEKLSKARVVNCLYCRRPGLC